MKKFTTKMLCRAGIVAALYAVLTFALGNLSFGTLGFQIRPAEALTILPLFYAECVPALFVGCPGITFPLNALVSCAFRASTLQKM